MDGDPDDRRRQRLSVTPAGVAVLRRGIVGSAERQARLRGCLGEADYEAFGRIVGALSAQAQAMVDEAREAREG
jgi:DNA-binding MarR family transcriptional regulator